MPIDGPWLIPETRKWIPVLVLGMLCGAQALYSQESFDDLASRAAAASSSNDSKTAISLYQAALRIKPDWRQGLWMSGSLLYESERYQDAAKTLRQLVVLTPQAEPGWAILGLCEYEIGEYTSALEHIERALTFGTADQPQMDLVLKFHKALLQTKFGRFDAALDTYMSFIGAQVGDPQVILGLGLLGLRRALAPTEIPESQRDLCSLAGNAYAALLANDQTRARQNYDNLIARYPNEPDALYAYGYFLLGSDADRAIEQWERALALDPSNSGANSMLAWTFSLRGDQEKALKFANAALKKDPNQAIGQIVLGKAMVRSGKIAEGLPHLEQAVLLQPGNLEAHLALATAYSEAGRKADAQRERQFCLHKQAESSLAQR